MIEQYYAVHKKTGEIFSHKGRYCFTEKGILQSLRNDIYHDDFDRRYYPHRDIPLRTLASYEIKKVVLT